MQHAIKRIDTSQKKQDTFSIPKTCLCFFISLQDTLTRLYKKPAYAGILAARLFKCPTEINQINQMNRMRFALFCDRAYSKANVTIVVPIHALETIVEAEVVRAVVVEVVVRSRTPIVAVVTVVVER